MKIIGINGLKQSGKDQFTKFFIEHTDKVRKQFYDDLDVATLIVRKKAFADELKTEISGFIAKEIPNLTAGQVVKNVKFKYR